MIGLRACSFIYNKNTCLLLKSRQVFFICLLTN
nr:MAG TPA: hypothetical protein [Caudoviricetes sp.]